VRRLERQIICEDPTGERYRIQVLINTHQMETPYGLWPSEDAAEFWLDAGPCYQPVNAVEPFEVFTFVAQGRIVTLRRVQRGTHLPSFLRGPTHAAP
jgi:hypothetical protein